MRAADFRRRAIDFRFRALTIPINNHCPRGGSVQGDLSAAIAAAAGFSVCAATDKPIRSMVRTRLFSLVVFLVILLAALKLGDLSIGYLMWGNPLALERIKEGNQRYISMRENPPNMDSSWRPQTAYLSGTDGLEAKDFRLRTDPDGFIIGPGTQAGSVDIVFIGGSTTESLYVEENKRFPYLVSQLLVGEFGWKKARTLNAGVSGNHSMHTLTNIIAKVIKHRPRIVVIMENINDLALLANTGSYWDAPPSRSIVRDPYATRSHIKEAGRAIKDVLLPNIWFLVRPLLSVIMSPLVPVDEFSGYRAKRVIDTNQMASDFGSALASNVAILKAWGIAPILMTQFNRIELEDNFVRQTFEERGQGIGYDRFVLNFKKFNEVVRNTAAASGIPLIDLEGLVPKNKQFIYDAVHLNDRGSVLVAGIISKAIAREFKDTPNDAIGTR